MSRLNENTLGMMKISMINILEHKIASGEPDEEVVKWLVKLRGVWVEEPKMMEYLNVIGGSFIESRELIRRARKRGVG